METYTYQQTLPSCTINRELLSGLEKRLLHGIPKLLHHGLQKILQGLGLESYKKLEKYRVVIDNGRHVRTLGCSKELQHSHFETGTNEVRLIYSLGAPRILHVEVVFSQKELPRVELATQSPQIERLLPRIAEGLCSVIRMYGNRHKLLHNSLVQSVLLFSVPLAVMAYGLFQGVDLFLLYTSMGWLCLFSLGMIMSLPRLFPWVTFESGRRFQWHRLPLLAKFAMLIVATGCYITLVLLTLPSATGPSAMIMAGFAG